MNHGMPPDLYRSGVFFDALRKNVVEETLTTIDISKKYIFRKGNLHNYKFLT